VYYAVLFEGGDRAEYTSAEIRGLIMLSQLPTTTNEVASFDSELRDCWPMGMGTVVPDESIPGGDDDFIKWLRIGNEMDFYFHDLKRTGTIIEYVFPDDPSNPFEVYYAVLFEDGDRAELTSAEIRGLIMPSQLPTTTKEEASFDSELSMSMGIDYISPLSLISEENEEVGQLRRKCFTDTEGSLRVEAEGAPEKLFASESECYSTEMGSIVVTAAPSTFEFSTDTQVQSGAVCIKQIDRGVKCNLDFSSLILPQSACSLETYKLATHEQKSATYDVTASLFNPSSSSFKSFSAHVSVLPLLAAASSVSPTCLECPECGPSNKRNNARQMLKALRHWKAKAKQKAKTDIAYCALLFKANRHRKAIAKLKKNVEVSLALVPPSLQYSPLMTRKPN